MEYFEQIRTDEGSAMEIAYLELTRAELPSQPPLQAIGEIGCEATRNRGLQHQVKGVDAAGIGMDLDRCAGTQEAQRVVDVLLEEKIDGANRHKATRKFGDVLCQARGQVMAPVGIDLPIPPDPTP